VDGNLVYIMQSVYKMKNPVFILLFLIIFLLSIHFDIGKSFQDAYNSPYPNSIVTEQSEPLVCGGWESIPCPEGYFCKQDPIIADGYGICKKWKSEKNQLQNLLSIRIKDSF
jgi:hypothetical protein